MNLATRARRTVKVTWNAAIVYASYKIPSVARKLTGRPPRSNDELSQRHEKTARRILALALDMRGVMIKMCQALATRSDVFPPEFITHLKQCHDAVPPKPYDVIRPVVEAELGKPLEVLFSEFDDTPVAAASIAQVHFATTVDGRDVAVKVLRPGIESAFRRDAAGRALRENLERLWRDADIAFATEAPRVPAAATRAD